MCYAARRRHAHIHTDNDIDIDVVVRASVSLSCDILTALIQSIAHRLSDSRHTLATPFRKMFAFASGQWRFSVNGSNHYKINVY